MGRPRLTTAAITKRMVELRNLRRLHVRDRERIASLEADNARLRHQNAVLQTTVGALQVQVAELQTMVFGKRRRPPTGMPLLVADMDVSPKQPRIASSYRRPIPPASAITATEAVPLPDACPHCGSEVGFTAVQTKRRYQEDVPLPELTPGYRALLVTDYAVEQGRCMVCGKTVASMDLGGAEVSLGSNVRLLVSDLVSRLGLSYGQVSGLLIGLYGLTVSDGEIAAVLERQHQAWLPASEQLKADIRAAPVVHADETPWAIQACQGQGYAWVLADAGSANVWYEFADSRGVSHAKALFGEDFGGIRISDDYAAYRALPGNQQLCWAHLYRCIRDLRYNDNLPEEQLPCVRQWYEAFVAIYQDLRRYLGEPYDETVRATQADELWQRLQALLPEANGEPDKLRRLKAQLQRAGHDKLFTCLTADTPCDNNRAERDLRQLVLKRKRSFGSKTQRGATALATILSICTTAWRRWGSSPAGYYRALAGV